MKNAKTAIACLGLAGILGIGGVAAYFTDGDEATNTFTFGKIDVTVEEPGFDEDKSHEDTMPNDVIAKDPKITNAEDSNDAYVFFEVTVPYDTFQVANEDGTLGANTKQALFTYEVNEGWTEVGEGTDNGDGTMTHVYAYASDGAMTALTGGTSTATLFDNVKVANIVEGEDIVAEAADVVVKGYAIQTTNVNGGKTAPADVWTVVNNAAGQQ